LRRESEELEVKLSHKGGWFEARSSRGSTIKLGPDLDDGVSPMEAVLMAAGGCTGVDVVATLAKMRQPLEGLEISVSGERREEHPRYYKSIQIKYFLRGKLDEAKVRRAIELSLEKYCSVTNALIPKAEVGYTFEIEEGDRD
jgi:putative redox protein